MSFWENKSVLVTGGAGFLGQHMVQRLEKMGAHVFVPRRKDYDLTVLEACVQCMRDAAPQIVIHSAAYYGGIWINQLYPGKIYYENLVMGANVMEAARLAKVEKFVAIGTACSYPGYLEGELSETNLWDGPLHESVVNYGMTKKMMAVQAMAYKKQYNFNAIHLILTNLYGPGDTYNPDRSHVPAALIRKFVEAKLANARSVEVWGSGAPIREFLYVEDCADAILKAAELYNNLAPMNIGPGKGTSIRELAETIQSVSGFNGKIEWNRSKPDGQMKKVLNVSRMKQILKWEPPTSLRNGLEKTILWYEANKKAADARY
ncbi:MAG: GDP-L-fucose synthase [Lentisphaerae bacterium]|nr:GDP-L-fucose synthase [Lentisphaerota bacterium]